VLLSVKKGQIPCHSFSDGRKVAVRFDKQPPQRFNAVGPSDSSTESIFIENEPRFIASARKATTILVQFTMFQAGEQILEFTAASPLEWGTKAAPPSIQPGHRQQATRLRLDLAARQRRVPRQCGLKPCDRHAAQDAAAGAVRDHGGITGIDCCLGSTL
jgi:hypothetical protein